MGIFVCLFVLGLFFVVVVLCFFVFFTVLGSIPGSTHALYHWAVPNLSLKGSIWKQLSMTETMESFKSESAGFNSGLVN